MYTLHIRKFQTAPQEKQYVQKLTRSKTDLNYSFKLQIALKIVHG